MVHVSYGKHQILRNCEFFPQVHKHKNQGKHLVVKDISVQTACQMILKCIKNHLLLHQFFRLKKEQRHLTSVNFYICRNKTCSEEIHALTCDIVTIMFTCSIHHAANLSKQIFRIMLHLCFEVDTSRDVSNTNDIRANDAPINMNENDVS